MQWAFSETVLEKYKVDYFYCQESGLLQTEKPYWLDEAYQSAIAITDTGIATRNWENSRILTLLLHQLFDGQCRFLDVAGGYGLLTRLLRDAGFDCYTTDKYCTNLFAPTFEPTPEFKVDALFAFEVLEHVHEPQLFIEGIFNQYQCKTLIFSTQTFSGHIPKNDWWYYAFETGQHISFYQPRTLSMLAKNFGCLYYSLGSGIHIITERNIPIQMLRVLRPGRLRKIYSVYVNFRRRGMSLTWRDHLKMKQLISNK